MQYRKNLSFCSLLITFANSLDPDQDQNNVGPDLVPNRLSFHWLQYNIHSISNSYVMVLNKELQYNNMQLTLKIVID